MTLLATLSGLSHYYILLYLLLHPIHVSVTEIEFDKKDEALEIMMRVFMDDLELALRNELRKPDLDILNPASGTSVDELANKYLQKHFKILLDGKATETRYLGHEREGQAFIFFVEVTDVQDWKTITIQNDIIMATHNDQSNIVHVFVDDETKSLRLTRNTPADELTFE